MTRWIRIAVATWLVVSIIERTRRICTAPSRQFLDYAMLALLGYLAVSVCPVDIRNKVAGILANGHRRVFESVRKGAGKWA